MNYGMEDQPQSNISKYLVVNVTLKGTRMILASLILGQDEAKFLGYSSTKKAYRFYNKRLHNIVESAYVRIDDIKIKRIISLDGDESTNDE